MGVLPPLPTPRCAPGSSELITVINTQMIKSDNGYLDGVHKISSLISKYKKKNHFSGQKSDSPPPPDRNQNFRILSQNPFSKEKLKSDYPQS